MYQSTFSQLSGRITQAGEGDDVSVKHNALHYVTYGVPPQTLPQWVGGLSLQQVGSTPHLLPTHCVQYHQWYANILIALPSPLKRGRDEQRMKKGTRVRLSLRSTALRFSPPFFRDHSAPLSRRGASLPSRLSPSYGGTAGRATVARGRGPVLTGPREGCTPPLGKPSHPHPLTDSRINN